MEIKDSYEKFNVMVINVLTELRMAKYIQSENFNRD